MDTETLKQTLLSLVEQTGTRDIMSGARQASLTLTLDGSHEMVVRATVHDRRRERIIAIIATLGCVVSASVALMAGFWALWSMHHGG